LVKNNPDNNDNNDYDTKKQDFFFPFTKWPDESRVESESKKERMRECTEPAGSFFFVSYLEIRQESAIVLVAKEEGAHKGQRQIHENGQATHSNRQRAQPCWNHPSRALLKRRCPIYVSGHRLTFGVTNKKKATVDWDNANRKDCVSAQQCACSKKNFERVSGWTRFSAAAAAV